MAWKYVLYIPVFELTLAKRCCNWWCSACWCVKDCPNSYADWECGIMALLPFWPTWSCTDCDEGTLLDDVCDELEVLFKELEVSKEWLPTTEKVLIWDDIGNLQKTKKFFLMNWHEWTNPLSLFDLV